MKHIILLVLVYSFQGVLAQVGEDFADGDFTHAPVWQGEDSVWTIDAGRLRSNSISRGKIFHLATASSLALEAQWKISMFLEFNPSSTNYADFVLISDRQHLRDSFKGYFVRAGGSADEISLYRKDGKKDILLIDGKNKRLNSTANKIMLWIKRDSSGLWQLFDDTTGTANFFLEEGSIRDTIYRQSAFLGIRVRQSTSSFFSKHFFDDVQAYTWTRDRQPPLLTDLSVKDPKHLSLNFNEALDSDIVAGNFELLPGGVLDSVYLSGSNQLILVLSKPLIPRLTYKLKYRQISDISGNMLAAADTNFVHLAPRFRSVRISEILPDPGPPIGLPDAEFIELYNNDTIPFDLAGWHIHDLSTAGGLISAGTILPGQSIILCAAEDTPLYHSFGTIIPIKEFPSLNNTSDHLYLFDDEGLLIDEIAYEAFWYKDKSKTDGGWSLELQNPLDPCDPSHNWSASLSPEGGTPGKSNSQWQVKPDLQAPALKDIRSISPQQMLLVFSEPLDSSSAATTKFSLSENSISRVEIQSRYPDFLILHLSSLQAYDRQKIIELHIDSVKDCWGNSMVNFRKSFVHFKPSSPQPLEVIFTEIMADPEPSFGLPSTEYIELFNCSSKPVSLEHCFFSDGNSSVKLPALILPALSYVLICPQESSSLFSDTIIKAGCSSWPGLSNDGEALTLLDSSGRILHTVSYDIKMHQEKLKAHGGWSLEMRDLSSPCVTKDNWTSSLSVHGGSPGLENSVKEHLIEKYLPEPLRTYTPSPQKMLLYYSNYLTEKNLSADLYDVDHGVGSPDSVSFGDSSLRQLALHFQGTLIPHTVYQLQVKKVFGCKDSLRHIFSLPFGLGEKPQPGDVNINELLFNPSPGGADFVELYNNSDKIIDLSDLYLGNGFDTLFIDDFFPIAEKGYTLFPKEMLALTNDMQNIRNEYRRVARILEIPSLPSYPDDEGVCFLFNLRNNSIHDVFSYNEKMHHVIVDNPEGISLEKIDPSMRSSDKNSWTSASTLVKATPGLINSQYRNFNSANGFLEIQPDIISPDGDGKDDFCFFQYRFDLPGYIGSIQIYDLYGILRKDILHNELLAKEGSIQYDGSDNYGNRLPAGIYPVLFNYYSTDGKTSAFKTSLVIGEKLNR